MTNEDLIKCADITLARANGYDQPWPYNVGYYNGIKITYDCHNTFKAWLWSNGSIASNYRVGNYAVYNPASGIGDWTTKELLDHCKEVSSDMKNILPGEYMWMNYNGDTHGGMYYGDGKVFEVTTGWGVNGAVLSDISSNGTRSYRGITIGKWSSHGKFPGVEYKEDHKYKVGDVVVIKDGAKVYGTDVYFASWVYGMPLTISQIEGDRIVVNTDTYVMGAVAKKDILPYEAPVEDPEPFHPGTQVDPEPVPDPIPEPSPEPDPDISEKTLLEKILETLQEILNFLKKVFTKGDKND